MQVAENLSVSLSIGYMAIKEGAGEDSEGLLEIPQEFEESRLVPRFPDLARILDIEEKGASAVPTPENDRIEIRAMESHSRPRSRGSSSSEETMDLDSGITKLTPAQYTATSNIRESRFINEPVSPRYYVVVTADGPS